MFRGNHAALTAYWLVQQAVLWAVFLVFGRDSVSGLLFVVDAISLAVLLSLLLSLTRLQIDARTLVVGLLATASILIASFSNLYWGYGTRRNFSGQLSRLDAVYFAVGTLSTAGTGDVSAVSETSREIQTAEMVLGMGLVILGAGAVLSRYATAPPLRLRSAAKDEHGDHGES